MKTWETTVVKKQYFYVCIEMPDDATPDEIRDALAQDALEDEPCDVDYDMYDIKEVKA
jgi:hypothetical protein